MGNCITRCCGILNRSRRKLYLKTRYSTERDQSIEFENLMDDEDNNDEMSRLLTDHERQLLKSRKFDAIVHEQNRIDKEIDEQLAQQEEELKRDEESFFEAKREASRIAKLQRAKEKAAKKNATINGSRSWLGDDEEWEVAGGEDDFEIFLANVKARSLAARSQVHAGQGDAHSSSSSTVHTKDRSLTEGSSLDLEWDHEADLDVA
ncbi:AP-1 complex-associated regulatory protein-like isoform X1 [Littorina saxatilis]|uniref:AP-1 complex-associated regulatory protein-like isoform X1 n=1 Tax=Littorina saxatilis TaxID=31220 RepID=UPI0038B5E83E